MPSRSPLIPKSFPPLFPYLSLTSFHLSFSRIHRNYAERKRAILFRPVYAIYYTRLLHVFIHTNLYIWFCVNNDNNSTTKIGSFLFKHKLNYIMTYNIDTFDEEYLHWIDMGFVLHAIWKCITIYFIYYIARYKYLLFLIIKYRTENCGSN